MLRTKEGLVSLGLSAAFAIASLGCEADDKGRHKNTEPVSPPVVTVTPLVIRPLPPLPIIGEQVKRVPIGESLRALEEQFGKRELTFQDATGIVSMTTRLYAESTGSPIITGDINNSVFIIEGSSKQRLNKPAEVITREELEQVPFIKKLISNYPAASFSDSVLRRVAGSGRIYGFVEENFVFINLDGANEESVTVRTGPYYPMVQFHDIGLVVNCSPLGPASAFRTTLLHELFHRDTQQPTFPLDPEFIRLFKAAQGWLIPVVPKEQYGFGIIGQLEGVKDSIEPVPLFEEEGADYIAARIATANGLGYYSSPSSLYDFGQILVQANVGDMTMLHLHRNGSLKEFMMRIGMAAEGKVDDPLSLAFALGRSGVRNFSSHSQYFPNTTGISGHSCR